MRFEKVKEYKAWFCSGLDLDTIGNALRGSGIIEAYEFDYENLYEWIACDTGNDYTQINVSRKHCDGESFDNEPISILLMYSESEPHDTVVEKIATEISSRLNVDVSLGAIKYLGGDDYEYRPSRVVRA